MTNSSGILTYLISVSFILNYMQGGLDRVRQSHTFPQSQKFCVENGKTCLQELDSAGFMASVLSPGKDVVVLVYAHWCGACQALSHTFLALAKYFAPSKHIQFARFV